MVILESILDDETLVRHDNNSAQKLSDKLITDNMNFRIYTRVGFANSQILRGELAATKIRLFLDEFYEILEHCCFIKEYVITGNIRVFDGPLVVSENIPFPIDDDSIETLDDAVDIIELKKKYPTVSLEFEFTILFSTPNKTPKYRDYIHSIHHIIDLIGNWFVNCPLKFYKQGQEKLDGLWLALKVNQYNPEESLAKIYDMLFDEHYGYISMLDNHNALLRSSRLEKICQEFADSRLDITFGGMEKYKYNPYGSNQPIGSSKDRQVAYIYLNYKETEQIKMEDALFDIYKQIVSRMSIRALRELTICIVCRCNKGFDCSLCGDDMRLSNKCNTRINVDTGKKWWGKWCYVTNNRRGSSATINRFFYWRQDGQDTGFHVMLMQTRDKLTNQKISYRPSDAWANFIQEETRQ